MKYILVEMWAGYDQDERELCSNIFNNNKVYNGKVEAIKGAKELIDGYIQEEVDCRFSEDSEEDIERSAYLRSLLQNATTFHEFKENNVIAELNYEYSNSYENYKIMAIKISGK